MGKILIIYASVHHKNTKKVIDYVAPKIKADVVDILKSKNIDTKPYDTVILASGIYANKIHKSLLDIINEDKFANKNVILIYTCGMRYRNYAKSVKEKLIAAGANYIGDAYCKGYDTFSFLKKIGGISKGHPSEDDMRNITEKVEKMLNNLK